MDRKEFCCIRALLECAGITNLPAIERRICIARTAGYDLHIAVIIFVSAEPVRLVAIIIQATCRTCRPGMGLGEVDLGGEDPVDDGWTMVLLPCLLPRMRLRWMG